MKSVFFGPTSISGIGQVTRKYAELVGGDFIEFGHPADDTWDVGFAFVLPIDQVIHIVKEYAKRCKKMVYYTICETEPVNDAYKKLFRLSDTLWTSSQFCSDVFKKQFPNAHFPVIELYAPPPCKTIQMIHIPKADYIFYHIGNIIDPRKNINALIGCFHTAAIPGSLLVLKATCHTPVRQDIPGVYIINEFLNDEQMESIHSQCHCYVSFSHSEGAGMGAVEAALRNKPVILQSYGGTKEYIRTPYMVSCDTEPVGVDDFLFKKEHMWGKPSMDDMVKHMRTVATERVFYTDHSFTQSLMNGISDKISCAFST